MLNQLDCYYWIAFVICIASTLIMAYIETKIHGPLYWLNLFIIGVVFFVNAIIPIVVTFDINGNKYDSVSWTDGDYKNAIYYTKGGEAFRIQGDKIVNIKDSQDIFDISKTYLDENGNLVFDKENKFHKTWRVGIFSSVEQEHVYAMSECSWDIFGNFQIPEARGFKIAGYYFSPCSLEIINNPDIVINEEAFGVITEFLILIFNLFPLIMITTLLLFTMVHLIKAIIKKSKVRDVTQYKLSLYLYIAFSLFIQLMMFSSTKSFIDLIVRWISYMILLYIASPYLQGTLQISYIDDKEDDYPNGILLKDMFQMADGKEVHKLRVRLMIASSISMVYWIITCIVYSIQSSLYC